MKNVNNRTQLPTLEELRLYQEGKLPAQRAQEIEAEAKTNPLLSEAMEGFAVLPVFAAVPGVETFLGQGAQAAASASVAGGTQAASVTAGWMTAKTLIIAAVSATVAITGTLLVVNNSSNDATVASPVKVQVDPAPPSEEKTDELNTATQEGSISLESSAIAENNNTVESLVSTQNSSNASEANNSILTAEASQLTVNDNDLMQPEGSELSSESGTSQINSNSNNSSSESPSGSNSVVGINIKHILNFQVADYSSFIGETPSKPAVETGGVAAQYASKEEQAQAEAQAAKEGKSKRIPYMQYLTTCISSIDRGDFKQAIEEFGVILEQYPDDVNAQFYSAHAYYQLGEYDKALGLYDKALGNKITKFKDESEFYKAKSLKALGRTEEANKIFTKIAGKNGFYSAKAAKELE